ncbi:N-acetyl-gamma-glutamyl-phosphate reductase [Kangiella geojedonensis]|uniref:N-acetyl-gamma-glutamyl-phosphate reductase n=1 Tax=Kangiella geojedonensis TaxID=914150 RepID=A0A0F6RDB8_9GAMM|nr:N-acetyl-gamma-glutamyl-phosphate reductase [Kangiella geojedonensis]AKE52771.1 N-acetyl-gamma-glutamyl-phosphate reductase [Kangiella geojedonensis]
MTIKTVLVGARGYVGSELISIISQHSSIELIAASSRELEGKPVQQYAKSELSYGNLTPDDVVELSPNLVILALPNGLASSFVTALDQKGASTTVIDLSADYRFDRDWSYSLPEVYQPKIMTRISNPGCYATAMQLSIAPVKHLVQGRVSCFGVSGYSGAGTSPSDKNNTELLAENVMPYSLANHLHEKEVSNHLNTDIKFSPHVAEFFRGISLTSHIPLIEPISKGDIEKLYRDFYRNAELVQVQSEPPQITQVTKTYEAIVGGWAVSDDGTHLAVNCSLDNLLKGAASQAIQNINIAFGLPQLEGLT